MTRLNAKSTMLLIAAGILCMGLLLTLIDLAIRIADPNGFHGHEVLQKFLVVASLTVIATLSYVSWPSRWNVLAHAQLAFCIVAVWLPLFSLNVEGNFSIAVYNEYSRVIIIGAAACLIGALAGKSLAEQKIDRASKSTVPIPAFIDRGLTEIENRSKRRVILTTVFAAVLLCLCFGIMGFIPALAENPMAAKFFKGIYAEPYSKVSIPYRISTTILALLVGVVMAYAWIDRRISLLLLVIGSVALMLLTLQRGPAAASILTFVGLIAAARLGKIRMGLYFLALLLIYAGGSALYWILGLFGLSNLSQSDGGLVKQVAAGAPDISDHLTFMSAWLDNPQTTLGRTFLGGLVPGNFEWNPGVWTLIVSSPSADITNISSGGFRLPVPIWGLVSFGTIWSVLIVCVLHGILVGFISRIARERIEGKGLKEAMIETAYFSAVLGVFGQIYAVSYVDAIALIAAYLIMRRGLVKFDQNQVKYI